MAQHGLRPCSAGLRTGLRLLCRPHFYSLRTADDFSGNLARVFKWLFQKETINMSDVYMLYISELASGIFPSMVSWMRWFKLCCRSSAFFVQSELASGIFPSMVSWMRWFKLCCRSSTFFVQSELASGIFPSTVHVGCSHLCKKRT